MNISTKIPASPTIFFTKVLHVQPKSWPNMYRSVGLGQMTQPPALTSCTRVRCWQPCIHDDRSIPVSTPSPSATKVQTAHITTLSRNAFILLARWISAHGHHTRGGLAAQAQALQARLRWARNVTSTHGDGVSPVIRTLELAEDCRERCIFSSSVMSFVLTLTVLVTTIDALRHFETG